MSVGLLAGSLPGAVMGFGTGLLVDTVLVQTLGVTSLLYIAIGYWSGRLRELRDPAHGLVPLAAGAAATAVAGIGMTLIQFLLGVDAPVSWLLAAADLHHRAGQHADLAARLRARAADHQPGAARRSAPPPPPRLHHRRPEPAAEPVPAPRTAEPTRPARPMIEPPEDRRPPLTPQLALRVAVVGTVALALFAIIFFRLWFLQVLSGHQYLAQATVNQERKLAIAAPRGRDHRPQRHRPGRQPPRAGGGDLPARAARARAWRIATIELATRARWLRPARARARNADRVRDRRPAAHEDPPASRLSRSPALVAQQLALLPYADATIKPTSARTSSTTSPSARTVPRRRGQPVNIPTTRRRRWPRSCSAPSAGSPSAELEQQAYRGVSPNAVIGQSGLEALYDRYLRGTRRLRAGAGQRARPADRRTSGRRARSPATTWRCRWTPSCRGSASRRSRSRSPAIPATGGAFVAMDPDERRDLRDGLLPDLQPHAVHQAPVAVHLQPADQPRQRRPAAQPRDPERRADRIHVQADHRHRGAAERQLDDHRHLRRHRPVLLPPGPQCLHNAGHASNGSLDLVNAIRVSSDTFFYNLGSTPTPTRPRPPNGGPWTVGAHVRDRPRRPGSTCPASCRGHAAIAALARPPQPAGGPVRAAPPGRSRASASTPGCGIADGPLPGRSATTSTSRSARATCR